MGSLVVVGGVNLDLTVQAGSRPAGGETVVGSGPVASSGGKGANQAVAAAYAGARVRLCAVVGDDAAGTEQLDQLRESGVDVSRIRTATGTATGTAFILLTPDGENSIVVGTGANADLGPDDVAAAVEGDADVVLAQTEPGVGPVEAAAEHARRRDARFVLNAAPVEGLPAGVLRQADPLVVNEHEAADLLRGLVDDVASGDLAQALRAHLGCASVVVSLGAEGAHVVADGTDERVTSPSVSAVDTTGAGDVLVGVVAARLADGWDLVRATEDACAAAARAVTSEGARGYLTPGS
ncbi:MAG: Sugar kinase ribokinase family [Marmoricola sp.]|nr:Sugar kinase ribokinase family [Marmoricola sp.]